MIRRSAVLVILTALVIAGCDKDSGLPTTHMQLGGQDFSLEIAGTSHTREVGLMHRDHLDADHGMLFLFTETKPQWFWNHDVRFPLDVVFLDDGETVVNVIHMNAYSDLNVGSDVPVKFAIELNEGTAQRLHLVNGTHLTIPPKALDALVPDK
jgi:uncharacterized protein